MYTPLYKVQLYITSFTHRSSLTSLVYKRFTSESAIINPKRFYFRDKRMKKKQINRLSAWCSELNTEEQHSSHIKYSNDDLEHPLAQKNIYNQNVSAGHTRYSLNTRMSLKRYRRQFENLCTVMIIMSSMSVLKPHTTEMCTDVCREWTKRGKAHLKLLS